MTRKELTVKLRRKWQVDAILRVGKIEISTCETLRWTKCNDYVSATFLLAADVLTANPVSETVFIRLETLDMS